LEKERALFLGDANSMPPAERANVGRMRDSSPTKVQEFLWTCKAAGHSAHSLRNSCRSINQDRSDVIAIPFNPGASYAMRSRATFTVQRVNSTLAVR
jgi:hypothetical protein